MGLLFECVDSNTRFYAPIVRPVHVCSFLEDFNSSSTECAWVAICCASEACNLRSGIAIPVSQGFHPLCVCLKT